VLDNLVGDLLNVTLDLNIGELAANQTLGSEEGVLGVDNGLALGGNTDETLAILSETNNGGSSTSTCSETLLTIQFFHYVMNRRQNHQNLTSELWPPDQREIFL
jgi:hypothetical protein